MGFENLIAYKGNVTLDKAIWDNIWGMYVTFDLEQRAHELTTANPFKRFTRMKKGKVGTRFSMAVTNEDEDIVYNDEAMLKGWSDGTTGWKVTFWIQGAEGHPFIPHEKGTQFALAAVELDDDQTPVDQVKRERVTTAKKHRKQGLSNYAALLCRTPEFWDWLMKVKGNIPAEGEDKTVWAKKWMCYRLDIESRAELDTNKEAISQFHKQIRGPYSEWYSQRQ